VAKPDDMGVSIVHMLNVVEECMRGVVGNKVVLNGQ
jgi:hypothetical protein